MRKLEWIATELYKVSGNTRYDFSEEYYENLENPKLGTSTKMMEEFFIDASILTKLLREDNYSLKNFTLDFSDEKTALRAVDILNSHNLMWACDEIDELVEIDNLNNIFRVYFSDDNIKAIDLIYGTLHTQFSLSKLSRILETDFKFSFYYNNAETNKLGSNYSGRIQNGIVEYKPKFVFIEMMKFENILSFITLINEFIDNIPDVKAFENIKPIISIVSQE